VQYVNILDGIMKKIDFVLPTEETVTLLCVGCGAHPHLIYLHSVRRGKATEDQRQQYENMRQTYANQLAATVAAAVPDADALITPPSSRDDVKPYRDAILKRLPKLIDLSEGVSREGKVKAAQNDTTLEQLINDFAYKPTGREKQIKSLVIVDETIGTGKTVATTLHHLRAAGLPIAENCKVTIAIALWVK